MSTQKETIDFILECLGNTEQFTTKAMFGEYALYAKGRVVALVCDDILYVKVIPESRALETLCEKDAPYHGAKPHYLVEEGQLREIEDLPEILFAIAAALPPQKPKKKALKRNVK